MTLTIFVLFWRIVQPRSQSRFFLIWDTRRIVSNELTASERPSDACVAPHIYRGGEAAHKDISLVPPLPLTLGPTPVTATPTLKSKAEYDQPIRGLLCIDWTSSWLDCSYNVSNCKGSALTSIQRPPHRLSSDAPAWPPAAKHLKYHRRMTRVPSSLAAFWMHLQMERQRSTPLWRHSTGLLMSPMIMRRRQTVQLSIYYPPLEQLTQKSFSS